MANNSRSQGFATPFNRRALIVFFAFLVPLSAAVMLGICLGGPEGGLPVTLVLLAGIALALFAPEKNTAAQELSA